MTDESERASGGENRGGREWVGAILSLLGVLLGAMAVLWLSYWLLARG